MLIWEITWKLSRSNATSTWSIEWNMTKKYHAYSYTMFFMILNVFFFWLQTISPSLLTASSFQLLCTSHVVTACDPNLGQGEVRICWMMEKKLFCCNFFLAHCTKLWRTHSSERCRSSPIRQLSLTRRAMKVFAEAAVSNIYSANQTHSSHLRLLFPLFLIFHEQGLKEQPPSSPPDTLFLPPSNVS